MFGSIGQNWRQIMQMPQQNTFTSGNKFPVQNATGGWMMGAPSVPQAPAPQPVAPMMGALQSALSFAPSNWYAQPTMPMQPPDEKNRFAAPMMSGWM